MNIFICHWLQRDPNGKLVVRMLSLSAIAAIAVATLSPSSHAQSTSRLSKEACSTFNKGTSAIVTLRKSGQSREQVKSTLAAQATTGADREKLQAIGKIVDFVFSVEYESLDTLPRRMNDLCTGTSQQAATAALSKLRVQHDKMTGIRWYFHPTSPKDIGSPGFYLVFGRDESGQFQVMQLITRYVGSDWLFVKDVWARKDGSKVSVPLSTTIKGNDWVRDHAGGKVWEQFDSQIVSKGDKAAVRSIAYSRDVTLRFEGSKYHSDRKLSVRELTAMQEMIEAYEAATAQEWK